MVEPVGMRLASGALQLGWAWIMYGGIFIAGMFVVS